VQPIITVGRIVLYATFSEVSLSLSLSFLPFPVLCNCTVQAPTLQLCTSTSTQILSPHLSTCTGTALPSSTHPPIRSDTALYSLQQDPILIDPILISALRNLHHPTKEVTPPQNLPAGCSQSVLDVAAHLYSPYWRNPTSRSPFLHLVPRPLRSM